MALIGCPDNNNNDGSSSYTCVNGTAAFGAPSGDTDIERCTQCDTGFVLNDNYGCRQATYTCAAGTPQEGGPDSGSVDEVLCIGCDAGYVLNDSACERDVVQFSGPGAPSGSVADSMRIVRFASGDGIGIGIFGGDDDNDIVSYDASGADDAARWTRVTNRSAPQRDTNTPPTVYDAFHVQAINADTVYYSTWNEILSYTVHADEDVSVHANEQYGDNDNTLGNFWYFVTTDTENNIWGNNTGAALFTTALAEIGGSFENFGNANEDLPEVMDAEMNRTRSNITGQLLFDGTTLWVGGEQMVWSGVMSEDTIDWTGYPAYDSSGSPVLEHRAFAYLNGVIHALGDDGYLFRLNEAGDAFEYITQMNLDTEIEMNDRINHYYYLIAINNDDSDSDGALIAWRSGNNTIVRYMDGNRIGDVYFTAQQARAAVGLTGGTREFFVNGQIIGNRLYVTYAHDDGSDMRIYSVGTHVE